jgi:hypothetical protein
VPRRGLNFTTKTGAGASGASAASDDAGARVT